MAVTEAAFNHVLELHENDEKKRSMAKKTLKEVKETKNYQNVYEAGNF